MKEYSYSIVSLTVFTLLFNGAVFSQQYHPYRTQDEAIARYLESKGELYFQFEVFSKEKINALSRVLSIDRVEPSENGYRVFAYANRSEFSGFQNQGIPFTVLSHPGDAENVSMSGKLDTIMQWNVYPTYTGYVNLMYYYAAQYPHLCEIIDAGPTVRNRRILFAKITNSISETPSRPRVMLSSTMHGDETTGFVLMLRLIDTLLRGSGTSPLINKLVNQCEIWINPNANPDGTYRSGDHTVNGATRSNYNGFDLNRNFPDPKVGPYPSGTRQQETTVMMQLASTRIFTLSANFHGGIEVFNFPWDTWAGYHPDDDWYIRLGKSYVDTVHLYSPSNYMTALGYLYPFHPGVVNGYAWYEVNGGRQDYMIYFHNCRESTIELSNTKLLPASQLPTLWNYNYRSLLRYIEQSLYGIKGTVKDSLTGMPVGATITIIGRDMPDSTFVRSDSVTGVFHRMIQTGNYTLLVRAPGYEPRFVDDVRASYDSTTFVNILMRPLDPIAVDDKTVQGFQLFGNFPNPFNPSTVIHYQLGENSFVRLCVYNTLGQEVITLIDDNQQAGYHRVLWDGKNQHAYPVTGGVYIYRLDVSTGKRRLSRAGKMVFLK